MPSTTPNSPNSQEFEGDYRPAHSAPLDPLNARIEPADLGYLLRLTDAVNTTLDLQTLLGRTAELVRSIIHYRFFSILLLNDHTHELRMRFQVGHSPKFERMRIPIGKGFVGQVAQTRQPLLINDISENSGYINANPEVRSELAVPLIAKNRLIGVIDLESEQPGYFLPEHQRMLTFTASRIATAIENARLYTRISRQAETLEVLNEISVEIASILELDPLLERVGQLLRRLIDYQMFCVMLLDEKGENLVTRYSWRFGHARVPTHRLAVNSGIPGAAVREWRTINAGDVSADPRFVAFDENTRSELVVPLFYKGRITGVLDLKHSRQHFFTEAHERILATLAAQVAIAIENARLYQRVHTQERQLERDISMARQVQLRLLPAQTPEMPHADLAARFLPARSIGGDLYDFVPYGSDRIAIVLGDVSGKAAPAALFAAMVSGIMRAAAAQQPAPAPMLALLNDALQERKLESQYVTLLFALWDDTQRTLTIANSGAVQPVIYRGCSSETIQAEGFPLGLFPAATFDELTVTTSPGDVIVFISDGILDAENTDEEMYGGERLGEVLCEHGSASATEIADAILADVTRFQGTRERFDDETIIVLKVR